MLVGFLPLSRPGVMPLSLLSNHSSQNTRTGRGGERHVCIVAYTCVCFVLAWASTVLYPSHYACQGLRARPSPQLVLSLLALLVQQYSSYYCRESAPFFSLTVKYHDYVLFEKDGLRRGTLGNVENHRTCSWDGRNK